MQIKFRKGLRLVGGKDRRAGEIADLPPEVIATLVPGIDYLPAHEDEVLAPVEDEPEPKPEPEPDEAPDPDDEDEYDDIVEE